MEEIQKKNSTGTSTPPPSLPSKPKTSLFACFGFSRKGSHNTRRSKYSFPITKKETNYIRSHHDHHPFQDQKVNIMKSTSTSTCRRWYLISWSNVRASKSATKTVPIDTSTTASLDGKRKRQPKDIYGLETTNSKSKSKSSNLTSDLERDVPATDGGSPPGGLASQIEAVLPPVPDLQLQTPLITQKPSETNTINLENKKPLESSKGYTCIKRVSLCRKIDSLRNSGIPSSQSQPCSPVQEKKKPKSSSASTRTATTVMSHSASFPTPRIDRSGPPAAAAAIPSHNKRYSSWSWSTSTSPVSKKGASRNNKAESSSTIIMSKKLDPLVGMSIIMVTLIIMLLWGRLCAILCTSAWFYFLPRLRSAAGAAPTPGDESPRYYNSNPYFTSNNSRDLDLNSKESKKKVVLEGFLERNRRNNIP